MVAIVMQEQHGSNNRLATHTNTHTQQPPGSILDALEWVTTQGFIQMKMFKQPSAGTRAPAVTAIFAPKQKNK